KLLPDRYARHHEVRDETLVAVGDGDGLQVGVDRKGGDDGRGQDDGAAFAPDERRHGGHEQADDGERGEDAERQERQPRSPQEELEEEEIHGWSVGLRARPATARSTQGWGTWIRSGPGRGAP